MSDHHPKYDHCLYIAPVLETAQLTANVKKAAYILSKIEFDSLAFMGMSGALSAGPVAVATGKTMIMVRKRETLSHSSRRVEGDAAAKFYIIIDDFMSTGETAKAIVREIRSFSPNAVCLGLLSMRDIGKAEWEEIKRMPASHWIEYV